MRCRKLGWLAISGVILIPVALSAAEGRTEIPFRLYRDYVIVFTGSIGPIQKLNFILDTGAVPSVVDRRVANKLRLGGHVEKVLVFGRELGTREVTLPEVRFGPVKAMSVPVLCQDLSFVEKELGVRVDAMIGFDVLGRHSFGIDYAAQKLVFGPVESDAHSHPIQSRPGFVYLTIHVQGRPLYLVVDTGARDLILFSARLGNRLDGLRTLSTKGSSNLAGKMTLKQMRLTEARLGTNDLGTLNAYLLDNPEPGNLGFDGSLGVRSLGLTRLAFDFERQTISWR